MKGYCYSLRGIALIRLLFALSVGLLAISSGNAADPILFGSLPLIQNFSGEEIGSGATIYCAEEAPDGTLYAGADQLLVYDGSKWSQVPIENTPFIRCLAVSGSRIWVGGLNEIGFFEKKTGQFLYTSETNRVHANLGLISKIFSVGDDIILLADKKVVCLPKTGGEAKIWELPSEAPLFAARLPNGVLVSQRTTQGIATWLLQHEVLEAFSFHSQLLNPKSFVLFSAEGPQWTFDTGGNIVERNTETGSERFLYHDGGEISRAAIVSGVRLNDYVYLATWNSGLFIINPQGQRSQIGASEGLAADQCTAVVPSKLGGVWVTTRQGISFVHELRIASWLPCPGTVRAIFALGEDTFIGTTQGTVRLTTDSRHDNLLAINNFTQLSGDLYASNLNGIYKWNNEGFEKKADSASVITSLYGRDGDIVYASTSKNLKRFDFKTGETKAIDVQGVPNSIVQTEDNSIWVSTLSGRVDVVDSDLRQLRTVTDSHQPSVLALSEGHPLILVEKNGFLTHDNLPVALSGGLRNLVGTKSSSGAAWVYGQEGGIPYVGVVEKSGGSLVWARRNVPSLARLKTAGAILLKEHKLLIGGNDGVLEINTDLINGPEITAPTVADTQVKNSKEKTVRHIQSGPSQVDNGLSHEEQELTVFLKIHPWGLFEKPVYESRILPGDDEWTSHKYGEPIVRRDLPTGRFTLQIRTRHLGQVGDPEEFVFVRQPPWYASQLGITIISIGMALLFYGAVKLRTWQIEKKTRDLEAKIELRTRELAKANSAKSEFLAAMSHEIRNPMNGVVGIVKMLQEANVGAREKYLLTTLRRCADQLRTTVDDVLDFSKIEQGDITLYLDTFDLAETINSTISAVDITGEKLELSSWAGSRPTVTGDQGKLAQILTNYLTNALKYGVPPRASVDVFVLDENEKRCRVTIAVKNPGPDLPPDELPKLFDSFQRGEFARVRRIGGNGLGLAICKKYAEAMGGTVGVTSSGGLTVFSLTLPFDKTEAIVPTEAQTLTAKPNARALAIEDEDYNRLVLGSILQKLGFKVDWAADGKTAIKLAEQNTYDLVLTDWLLPDTNGGELTQKILALSPEPKPPVFAITAYSTREKQEECARAGMAGFISKPITAEKLEAALQAWGGTIGTRPAPARATSPAAVVEEPETPRTAVSVNQLSKLGPVEFVIPDFAKRIAEDWRAIEKLIDTNPIEAANAAHKLVSATLLIEAAMVSDQLRLLETNLRAAASPAEIQKLREVCRDEIESVVVSLRAALKRRQRISEVPTRS